MTDQNAAFREPISVETDGECNCCSDGAEETFRLEVKVTEL